MPFNTISVIGLGYIGLPTAAMFASKEKSVIGVDVNQHVVDTINAGHIHIIEPELDIIVRETVNNGFLKATVRVEPSDVFLIAVPTPFLPVNIEGSIPQPDLSYIKSAARAIAKVLKKGDLVILESTSPVGTTEQLADWLAGERSDLSFPQTHGEASDIRVAYCPERVLPGHVVRELVENDRVIGGITESCSKAAVELYKIFVTGECVVTNSRTAEMAKLTENACRDVQIAFANELSIICSESGIDVWELIALANRHPRINILKPGPGVGGHCIAVDPWFIVGSARGEAKLIKAARERNLEKESWTIAKIKKSVENWQKERNLSPSFSSLKEGVGSDAVEKEITNNSPKVALFGLAFKPDIDDLRESPALQIAKKLSLEINNIVCVEPNLTCEQWIIENSAVGESLTLVSADRAIKDADIIVFLVAHKGFEKISVHGAEVLDFCGVTQ